jgi:hypothetical protein
MLVLCWRKLATYDIYAYYSLYRKSTLKSIPSMWRNIVGADPSHAAFGTGAVFVADAHPSDDLHVGEKRAGRRGSQVVLAA